MICPECKSSDLVTVSFDEKTKDLTYQCKKCKFIMVTNTTPDDEVIPYGPDISTD